MSQETEIAPEKPREPVRPVVYGYVRLAEVPSDEDAVLAELEVGLIAWCEREGWNLAAIFRDIGVPPDDLIRPGFSGLLDVLALPDTYAAVVPDVSHLSSLGTAAKTLRSCIRRTGVKLLVKGDDNEKKRSEFDAAMGTNMGNGMEFDAGIEKNSGTKPSNSIPHSKRDGGSV